jgi:hypothetical protein
MKYPHPADLMALPCGGIASLDNESGFMYRCGHCLAVVGSVGMPRQCQDEIKKWDNWEKLGGQGWNYRVPNDYMDDWT